MSQYNYPKINEIKPPLENYVFFYNAKRNTIIDSRVTCTLL